MKNNIAPLFSRIHLTVWITGSVLAALASPFGSYRTDHFPTRFLYWILVFSISTVMAEFCGRFAKRIVGSDHPILEDLVKVAAMAVVFTPALVLLTNGFVSGAISSWSQFIVYLQAVAIVSTAICISRRVLPWFKDTPYGKIAGKNTTEKPKQPAIQPRLIRRLPTQFEGPILRLAVDDHFVDVVTAKTTHRIRLRFLDAINEMDTVEGYCTHRSHWVTRDAIVRAERVAGRTFLRIANQDLVPVSRKYKAALQSAGIV